MHTISKSKLKANMPRVLRDMKEIGVRMQRGKLQTAKSPGEFADWFDILPVDVATWTKSIDLYWDHRDPADRTIVANALLLACPLVTSNAAVRAYYGQAVW